MQVTLEVILAGLMVLVQDEQAGQDGRVYVVMPSTAHGGHDMPGMPGHTGEPHTALLLRDGVAATTIDGMLLDFSTVLTHEPASPVAASSALELGEFSDPRIPGLDRKWLASPRRESLAALVILDGGAFTGMQMDRFETRWTSNVLAPNIVAWRRTVTVLDGGFSMPASASLRGGASTAGERIPVRDGAIIRMAVSNLSLNDPQPSTVDELFTLPDQEFDANHLYAFSPLVTPGARFSGRSLPQSGFLPSQTGITGQGIGVKCYPRKCAAVWLPAIS